MPLITNGTTVKKLTVNGTACKEAYANGAKVFSSYEPWNLCSLSAGYVQSWTTASGDPWYISGGGGGALYVNCNYASDGSYMATTNITITIPASRVGDANRITYNCGLAGNVNGQGDYLNINGTHIVTDGTRSGTINITPNSSVTIFIDRVFAYGYWGQESNYGYIGNFTFSQV